MDNEEPEIILLYIRRMRVPPPRRPYRPNTGCQLLFKSDKTAGIIMAIPFVICFALFGIFNLIAGTILTTISFRRKISQKVLRLLEKLNKEQLDSNENFLDPMKVVGTILLLTGSLLVIVGILLGIVACRSANFDNRRRSSCASFSGFPASSALNGPDSFAVMSSVGRQMSSRLKVGLTYESRVSFGTVSASTSTKKSTNTMTTTADVHKCHEDELSSSVNGDLSLYDRTEDGSDTKNKRTCEITWSDDTPVKSILKSPSKKSFSAI